MSKASKNIDLRDLLGDFESPLNDLKGASFALDLINRDLSAGVAFESAIRFVSHAIARLGDDLDRSWRDALSAASTHRKRPTLTVVAANDNGGDAA